MISYNLTVTELRGEISILESERGVCTIKNIKSHPRVSFNLQKREESVYPVSGGV